MQYIIKVTAMRIQKRACILIKNDTPVLAGQDIFDRYMTVKATN